MNSSCTSIISLAVVPVVIISACGLLCLTFYNRLAFIVNRLRALQRERLHGYKEVLQTKTRQNASLKQHEREHYLHMLEEQTAKILKRAQLLRSCIFGLIFSIICNILTSLSIVLGHFYAVFQGSSVLFFLIGMTALTVSMLFAFWEIKVSLNPIELESEFMQKLIKEELENISD